MIQAWAEIFHEMFGVWEEQIMRNLPSVMGTEKSLLVKKNTNGRKMGLLFEPELKKCLFWFICLVAYQPSLII